MGWHSRDSENCASVLKSKVRDLFLPVFGNLSQNRVHDLLIRGEGL